MQPRSDIRTDIVTPEQFERNCMHYADWGLFTPPERFMFHHYDEPADRLLICQRPMGGIERYVVNGVNGGFYGIYDTRDVGRFLLTETWIEVKDPTYFLRGDVAALERQLREKREELAAASRAAQPGAQS